MRQALLLALALWAVFYVTAGVLDLWLAATIGFSAMAAMTLVNCVTFLWLWYVRATPLALGMALGWGGQAGITIWWMVEGMPGAQTWLDKGPLIFLFISIYMVGGLLHIAVIQNSTGSARMAAVWPILAIVAVAAGVLIGA
jgi:hypothetical protein